MIKLELDPEMPASEGSVCVLDKSESEPWGCQIKFDGCLNYDPDDEGFLKHLCGGSKGIDLMVARLLAVKEYGKKYFGGDW